MIYKERPLWSWGSAFGHKSAELLLACLINLLPESFGALSVSVWTLPAFLGACPGFGGWCLHLITGSTSQAHQKGYPARTMGLCWSGWGNLSPSEMKWVLVAQRNLERSGNQPGSPDYQTGKNPGSNSDLFQEAEGESDQLSKGTLVTTFYGVKPCLSGAGSGMEAPCYVTVCESVSLRWSLLMKQMWSPDLWLSGKLTWSRVSPNRASGPGLIQTLYGQEMPKSLWGEGSGWRWTKWVVLFVFPCVPERRTPYLLSTVFIPSIFVSV
jgi:hypothetical protein